MTSIKLDVLPDFDKVMAGAGASGNHFYPHLPGQTINGSLGGCMLHTSPVSQHLEVNGFLSKGPCQVG